MAGGNVFFSTVNRPRGSRSKLVSLQERSSGLRHGWMPGRARRSADTRAIGSSRRWQPLPAGLWRRYRSRLRARSRQARVRDAQSRIRVAMRPSGIPRRDHSTVPRRRPRSQGVSPSGFHPTHPAHGPPGRLPRKEANQLQRDAGYRNHPGFRLHDPARRCVARLAE